MSPLELLLSENIEFCKRVALDTYGGIWEILVHDCIPAAIYKQVTAIYKQMLRLWQLKALAQSSRVQSQQYLEVNNILGRRPEVLIQKGISVLSAFLE